MNDNNHPFGPGSRSPLADQREMPACYPIKGNVDSMKYHRPDSSGYKQTKAEVWFDSPSAAEAAGFALAGSHPDGSDASVFEPGGSQHPCDAATVNANRSAAMGAGTSGEITVDGNSTKPGMSGGAKAAGAAGAAGIAGAAGLAASGAGDMGDKVTGAAGDMGDKVSGAAGDLGMGGVDGDMDMGGKSGMSGGAKAAGAAGVAGIAGAAGLAASGGKDALGKVTGAAGDMGGKVTGAAGDMGGKVTGAAGSVGGKATAAGAGLGAAASGAAGSGRDKVTVGGTAASGAVGGAAASGGISGGNVRTEFNDDDDDGAGLAGCLRKWWWLLALILGIIILGLLLSQCNFGDDDDGAAAPVAETSTTTTEAEEEEVEETTTTTAAPETTTTTEAPETTTTTEAPEPEVLNLAGVAAATSPTVVGVLGPLGLDDALSADGPVTVFLPSDEGAVAALEAQPDLVTNVSDDPLLAASILGFHVVPGTFTAADLADGATLVTSTGLELTVADGAVNGIEISSTDLEGSNGVIHVIEGILFPPAEPQLAVTGASSELLGALGAALLITGGAFVVTSRRREETEAA